MARNTALSATGDVLGKLCSLVFFALIAREFGDSTLGHYVFALAVTSLIWSFAGFGLDRMAMRDVARDPEAMRMLVVPLAVLKGGASFLAALVAAGALAVAGRPRDAVLLVLILGVAVSLGLVASTAQTVFAANERMEHVFLTKVPWSIVQAAAGIVVILAGGSIVLATVWSGIVVGLAGVALCFTLLVRRYGRPRLALSVREWPGLLRRAVPFGLQEMLGQIVFRFDTVLLAFLAASAVVGAYGAAYRLLEATLFLVWGLGFAVMPMYSYLEGRAHGDLQPVFEGSLKLAVAIMAPIAAVLLVCAESIVETIYGLPEYADSVGLLRLLAPAIVLYGVGHLAGMLVLVRRPGRLTVQATAAVGVFNVALCFALIPWLGAEGAAIATLASEGLLAALGLWLARPVIDRLRLRWIAATPLLAGLAMAGAMVPFADRLWLALPLGCATYAAVLLALEARRLREDLTLVRSIAGQRPEPETA